MNSTGSTRCRSQGRENGETCRRTMSWSLGSSLTKRLPAYCPATSSSGWRQSMPADTRTSPRCGVLMGRRCRLRRQRRRTTPPGQAPRQPASRPGHRRRDRTAPRRLAAQQAGPRRRRRDPGPRHRSSPDPPNLGQVRHRPYSQERAGRAPRRPAARPDHDHAGPYHRGRKRVTFSARHAKSELHHIRGRPNETQPSPQTPDIAVNSAKARRDTRSGEHGFCK